jgi:GNAT superfamily N-acetyltransferase
MVRPAVPADAVELAEVARRAITVTAASTYNADQIDGWSAPFTTERLRELVATTSVQVVEIGGEIAGFASLVVAGDGRAELDLLYVEPRFSGRCVARLAVETVEFEARGIGADRLWADASRLAAPVLEHLGYEVVERYEKVRGPVSFPNTWLVKELRPSR